MTKFVPNPAAIKILGRTAAYEAALRDRAEAVAEVAKDIARSEAFDEGDYHDSIAADSGADEDGRVIGRTNAHDFKSGWIEVGSLHNRAIHTLSRAAERLGLRVRKDDAR